MPSIPPFTVLALAPFGPVDEERFTLSITDADLYTLDQAAADIAPRFWVELARDICPEGGVTIAVDSLAGFKPENVVKNTAYLAGLLAARELIREARANGDPAAHIAATLRERFPGLPLDLSLPAPAPSAPAPQESSAVDDILSMVAQGPSAPAAGQADMPGQGSRGDGPAAWQDQAQGLLSACLRAIFADPAFRTYEAAWSGARCLARKAGIKQGGQVRLRLAAVSPATLGAALAQAIPMLAMDVPHLTVIDQAFDNTPASVELLAAVADYADALLAPTALELGPAFFRLERWDQLSKLGYLNHALEDAAYAKFRKLREHPGAARVMALVNRFLERAPFGPGNPARPAAFDEAAPLWISPAWGLATLCAKSVMACGWPTRFTDAVNIRMEELAVADDGQGPAATQALFSEDRTLEFIIAGLTPLLGGPGKDFAFIPRQACLDGGSLGFQLFFGRIVSYLLDRREQAGEVQTSDPAGLVRDALATLFTQTGQTVPEDLHVEAGPQQEGRTPLTVSFTPPRRILGGEHLDFTFGW